MWICYRWRCSRYFFQPFPTWLFHLKSLWHFFSWVLQVLNPSSKTSQQIAETKKCSSHLPRFNGAMHSCANCRRHSSAKKLYNRRNLTLKTSRSDESWILRWNPPVLRARLRLFFRKLLQVFPKSFPSLIQLKKKIFTTRVVFRASHLVFLLALGLHNFFIVERTKTILIKYALKL